LDARECALGILLKVEQRAGFADVLLGARLRAFSPPDRRLITRMVLGTLAWRGRLDYEIEHLASRPLALLHPAVLAILRLGLFQARYLDRIPLHAVVDTSDELAGRRADARNAKGLVNAVMRRASREQVDLPPRGADPAAYLTVACSHPRWLVGKFIDWFGESGAEQLMLANNQAAPNAIRLNLTRGSREELLAKLGADGIDVVAHGRAPETVIADAAPPVDSASYRSGLFHLQSEASQLVARLLDPAGGTTVVDCAAAPGGKTTHLAELVGPRGRVVALDRNTARLRHARELVERLAHANIHCVSADLTSSPPLRAEQFDYVLLDSPCTGLGTLRGHPEIRWRLEPADIGRIAQFQLTLLKSAATLVRPRGAIVYAVCSVAPPEGRGVVDRFLASHRDFAIDRDPPAREMLGDVLDADGCLTTRPDRGGLDGFFAARLLRS
ncbi:MAG: 16S rRNA (cytosine(967)-C(5))-methyltransferase RsmB, partial [Candidatus Binataceae bacterium]